MANGADTTFVMAINNLPEVVIAPGTTDTEANLFIKDLAAFPAFIGLADDTANHIDLMHGFIYELYIF
jgi:hypothetical protein